ncbi:MAG: phosphatase PAP2 family protein [Erysipelotrichia bacterium]|nr:phosphatase PAP2 family protein [Erysipelotrichia bacterium]
MTDTISRKRKHQIKWALIYILYICAFLCLSRYDLAASMYLTEHRIRFAVLIGTHVSILPTGIILGLCASCLCRHEIGWKKNLCFVISVVGDLIVSYYIFQPKINLAGSLLIIVGAFPLWILNRWKADHTDMSRKEAVNACVAGILLVICSMAVTSILKMVWARPRFISLENPAAEFVPWYQFGHFNTSNDMYKSFPSGHTTAAATILWIVLLPHLYPHLKGHEKTLWIISIVWIAIAAFSRIMAGMHYISDTMGAFLVVLSLFLYFRKKLFPSDDKQD